MDNTGLPPCCLGVNGFLAILRLLRGFRHLLGFEAYELTAHHNHVLYWHLKLQLTLRLIAYQSLL